MCSDAPTVLEKNVSTQILGFKTTKGATAVLNMHHKLLQNIKALASASASFIAARHQLHFGLPVKRALKKNTE